MILVMKDGKVIEQGNHESLLEQGASTDIFMRVSLHIRSESHEHESRSMSQEG